MASHDPDVILKAVRAVPEFDGNPNVLPRFINICDQIVRHYVGTEPGSELTNLTLINCILNKITGSAARFINSNGISENWLGIRTALINNFSDQRDETALYNDLALATQGSNTPQEYYERCQTLFSTIMTYVMLHETVPTTVEAKRTLYRKLTMQAYVRGLKEPLGSRIRCMRPDSIEKALEFVQEELNAAYMQNRNEYISEKKALKPSPVTPMVPSPPAPKAFNFSPTTFIPQMHRLAPHTNFMPQVHKPALQQPQPWRQNQVGQPNHHQPTRTQQMFRALPPNYNPQSNVFKLPPRNQHQFPKPMSGVVNYIPKELPPSNFNAGGFSQSNLPRQMNIHEFNFHEHDYNDYPEYYCPDPEPCYYYPAYYTDYENDCDTNTNSIPYFPNAASNTDLDDQQPSISENQLDFQKTSKLRKPK